MVRLEVEPVPHRQQAAGGAAGVDHLLAFPHREGHGFFANDVLAGPGRPDGVLGVHGVGQHHVHDVNVGVVADGVEVAVVVEVAGRHVVLFGPGLGLFRRTGYHASQPAPLGFLEGGGQLQGAVVTQPYQGHAQFPGFLPVTKRVSPGCHLKMGRGANVKMGRCAGVRMPKYAEG